MKKQNFIRMSVLVVAAAQLFAFGASAEEHPTSSYTVSIIGTAGGIGASAVTGNMYYQRKLNVLNAKKEIAALQQKADALKQAHSTPEQKASLDSLQTKITSLRTQLAKYQGEAEGAANSLKDLREINKYRDQGVEHSLSAERSASHETRVGTGQTSTSQQSMSANNSNAAGLAGMSAANESAMNSVVVGPGTNVDNKSSASRKAGLNEAQKDFELREDARAQVERLSKEEATSRTQAATLEEQIARVDADLTNLRKIELESIPNANADLAMRESNANMKVLPAVAVVTGVIGIVGATQTVCAAEDIKACSFKTSAEAGEPPAAANRN